VGGRGWGRGSGSPRLAQYAVAAHWSRDHGRSPPRWPGGTSAPAPAAHHHTTTTTPPHTTTATTPHTHRPPAQVDTMGGLHGFINWPRGMLTDSGGFQMVSLLHLADITEEGVEFQSPVDGSKMLLTPEQSIQIQNRCAAARRCGAAVWRAVARQPGVPRASPPGRAGAPAADGGWLACLPVNNLNLTAPHDSYTAHPPCTPPPPPGWAQTSSWRWTTWCPPPPPTRRASRRPRTAPPGGPGGAGCVLGGWGCCGGLLAGAAVEGCWLGLLWRAAGWGWGLCGCGLVPPRAHLSRRPKHPHHRHASAHS
jgi:hypothetical protein